MSIDILWLAQVAAFWALAGVGLAATIYITGSVVERLERRRWQRNAHRRPVAPVIELDLVRARRVQQQRRRGGAA